MAPTGISEDKNSTSELKRWSHDALRRARKNVGGASNCIKL